MSDVRYQNKNHLIKNNHEDKDDFCPPFKIKNQTKRKYNQIIFDNEYVDTKLKKSKIKDFRDHKN